MKPEPTLPEKIADIKCPLELDGMQEQIEADSLLTPEIRACIATRRAELQRKK